jgi:hypothetical protein
MSADDHRPNPRVQRYYDLDGRDYHHWNAQEERAYRHWVEKERRQAYRQYRKANKQQQREYWRWRHANPDWR